MAFVVGGLRGRVVGIFFRLGNDCIDAGNDFGGLLGRGVLALDMNKEHSLEMIKQVDAFLATNPDPGIVALGKEGNVQQAIKLLPTAKFEVKKPSRAVHIC